MRLSECHTMEDLQAFMQAADKEGCYWTYMKIVDTAKLDLQHVVLHLRQTGQQGALDFDFHMIGIYGIIMGSEGRDLYTDRNELLADIRAGRYVKRQKEESDETE